MSDHARQVGERLFTDGITRPMFEDADGRQYVEDDQGGSMGLGCCWLTNWRSWTRCGCSRSVTAGEASKA